MFSNLEEIQATANGGKIEEPEEVEVEVEEEIVELEVGEEYEPEQEENPEEEEKPRSKMIPRSRFDEVNEKARRAETEKQQLEWRVQQLESALEKAVGLSGEEPQEEDDEVIDTALEKKIQDKFAKLEKQQMDVAINAELRSAPYDDIEQAKAWYVAANAASMLERAKYANINVTKEQALQAAVEAVNDEMKALYQRNPQPGALSEYIYRQAKYMGYSGDKPEKKSTVNMKAVDKLRREAGAPAVQKEGVLPGGGNVDWKADLKKRNKDAGISENYLKKWFS